MYSVFLKSLSFLCDFKDFLPPTGTQPLLQVWSVESQQEGSEPHLPAGPHRAACWGEGGAVGGYGQEGPGLKIGGLGEPAGCRLLAQSDMVLP